MPEAEVALATTIVESHQLVTARQCVTAPPYLIDFTARSEQLRGEALLILSPAASQPAVGRASH